jgi:hypothetical protein
LRHIRHASLVPFGPGRVPNHTVATSRWPGRQRCHIMVTGVLATEVRAGQVSRLRLTGYAKLALSTPMG